MFGLLLIPALLGIAFIADSSDDDDENNISDVDVDDDDQATGETIETELGAEEGSFDGTGANDRVADTDASSFIDGGAGNDFIQGFGGLDTIEGGTGNDTIFAGDGDDLALGNAGNDRVFLGDGDDIYSPETDETADLGNDFVRGGAGDDEIVDFNGSNTIFGDAGDDILATFGTAGNLDAPDTVDGGAGDDLFLADNADILTGGEGEDFFGVLDPASVDTDAVIITDFNPDEDTLIALVPEAEQSSEAIEFEFDESENVLRALWRGDELATLNGLTLADADSIETFVVDAEDLLQARFT